MVLKKLDKILGGGCLSIIFSILLIIFMQLTTSFCNLIESYNCAMHEPTYAFALCIFIIGLILLAIGFILSMVEKNNTSKEVVE